MLALRALYSDGNKNGKKKIHISVGCVYRTQCPAPFADCAWLQFLGLTCTVLADGKHISTTLPPESMPKRAFK